MNCEELRPDYLLYAMGTMGEPESSKMRSHLARGCETCTEGVRQAHAMAYSMGTEVKGPELPRALRARVLAIAGTVEEKPSIVAEPGRDVERRQVERERMVRDVSRRQLPFWARPMAAWQGLALAAGCVLLALAPAVFWYSQASESRARQASTGALLESERRSTASLREHVAKLEFDAAPHTTPIFSLELERGGASGEALKQLAIPREAAAIVLALPTDLARQASAAEIRNASGQAIWAASPLPVSDADSTGLTVAARLLPPGRYSVVLLLGDRTLAHLSFQATSK